MNKKEQKNLPKFSVLLTVYKNDNPKYLDIALGSLYNQTVFPDEVVLVKDGIIGDDLQDVIRKYSSLLNIKELQLEKNIGLGLALNEGINICKNELIARMDSDDYSMPLRFEKQLLEFVRHPKLDIVGLCVKEFSGDINNIVGCRNVPLTNSEIYKFAKTRDPFNHPTVMYKKSSVINAGYYGNYRKNQDTDLWIKMLSKNCVCKNLDGDLFRFRFEESTFKKRKNFINTKLLLQIRYKAYKDGFCSLFDFMKVAIAQIGIYILPIKFQKIIYAKFLRRATK